MVELTRTIFLISLVFMLSNCVSDGPEAAIVKLDSDEMTLVCTREKPTGSHLPVKVCRTQAQIDEEREMGREIIRRTTD